MGKIKSKEMKNVGMKKKDEKKKKKKIKKKRETN